jgi:ATP-dependent Clp protease ATP-binding subunit ClpX
MIPEFVGRLPVIAPLASLDVAELARTLTEPRNALVRQYQHLFALEKCELEFTPEALAAIAERALKLKTGVRAARSIIESLMLGLVYHLPEKGSNLRYLITREFALGQAPVTIQNLEPGARQKSA